MGALERAGHFVRSKADMKDLRILADMRNGIVHAAGDTEIEERILATFLQHCDAILADLRRDRADFWDGQLPVVDVLIRDASDKVAQRVEVRLAAAEAWRRGACATEGEAVIAAAEAQQLRPADRRAAIPRLSCVRLCLVFSRPASTAWSLCRMTGTKKPVRSPRSMRRSGSPHTHTGARSAVCGWTP